MLGFLESIFSLLGGFISMFVDYAEQIGGMVANLFSMCTWFIGTFVVYIPQPLAILCGLSVGVMLLRFAISRGAH